MKLIIYLTKTLTFKLLKYINYYHEAKKYKFIFIDSFGLDEWKLRGLKYQEISEWYCFGHMSLITEIEGYVT